jgi:hypothetical protein
MFRRALLTGLMIIVGSGLMVTAVSGTAAASPSVCSVSSDVIQIASFAFNPSAVVPGGSSTATLTAVNCTDESQQTNQTWSGRFVGSSTGIPPGCPVIDPISLPVTFPPNGTVSSDVTYSVPSSCTASQLVVTADIYGSNGALLAEGTAILEIVQPSSLPVAMANACYRTGSGRVLYTCRAHR